MEILTMTKNVSNAIRSARKARGVVRPASPVESLESRTLLSAAVTATLTTTTVATSAPASTINLANYFDDTAVAAGDTTVLVQTTNGNIPLELFNSVTPLTVTNFLDNYVNTGLYNGTIFHRAVSGFIDQTGGFTTDGTEITTAATVNNEFHVSNTRGTIAMAKLGSDPNSATDQWFINVADNSSNLDNQNGGFTVFGKVLYNGMTVADAINALPKVDGGTLNAQFSGSPASFPVQNGALTPDSALYAPSNLVIVNHEAVVPHVSFTATSDTPSLVSSTIDGSGMMTLSYASNVTGRAHVTVTATDLGGGTATQTFLVDVGVTGDEANIPVGTGTGAHKMVQFKQADGTTVSVSLKGAGVANLLVSGDTVTQNTLKNGTQVVTGTNLTLTSVSTTGTNAKSTLNFATKGGGKVVNVGTLTTDAPIGTINGKLVNLTGNLNVAGTAKSIMLHGANNGTITIGGGTQALTLKGTTAFSNESLVSAAPVNSITVPAWDGGSNATSSISAPTIKTFNVKGDLANTTVHLIGAGVQLSTLKVGGAMTAVNVNASGEIKSVTARSMANSHVFAGVGTLAAGQPLPASASDLSTSALISSVSVKTTFSNSNIAAQSLGHLTLGTVQTSNGGTAFGVAGRSITSVTFSTDTSSKRQTLKKLAAATDSKTFGDFDVTVF
jgi:peptidyl-prolyl cis-trans isomerase A (cyclophilin A)